MTKPTRTGVAVAFLMASSVAWAQSPPACPTGMGIVDRTAAPPLIYLPADPAEPEACRLVLRGGAIGLFWFGSWKTDWPGAEPARFAYRQAYANGPGTVVRFDTVAAPGLSWHETIRNEGFETVTLAGAVRHTMKVSHEREGFDGNTYHSIVTQWKDMETNMTVYQTYTHLSGRPEPFTGWDPLTIVGGRAAP